MITYEAFLTGWILLGLVFFLASVLSVASMIGDRKPGVPFFPDGLSPAMLLFRPQDLTKRGLIARRVALTSLGIFFGLVFGALPISPLVYKLYVWCVSAAR
jgi:hypothetical protein